MASLALYWSVMIACYLLASRLRRYADRLGFVNTLLSVSVYALVFVMGLRMGANREVTDNLGVIGVQALLVTALTMAFSMLGAFAVRRALHIDRNALPRGAEKTAAMPSAAAHADASGSKTSLIIFAMVAGSLLAGVVYSLLSPMTLREGLAISAGFGWYTLAPSVISGAGHAVAGAVSFLHNVLRETLGIILLPLAASKIGCIEAVTLPGTCAMDVCLPIVERSCSAETLPYSFTTGMAACLFSALLVPLIMGA